jgi:hypothetical protein
MAVTKKIVERRKDKRFQAEDGAAAVFRRPWPHSTRLGQIIDISKGGLAFRYIAGEEQSHGPSELEILWGDCSVRLDKMPFETISDFKTATEAPLNSIEMMRSSVQFGELTSEQMSQLEYFIRNHTTGEV